MITDALQPYSNTSDAPPTYFLGLPTLLRATGPTTNGAFGLVEQLLAPGFASPYHTHHLEDEAFYVLEGEMAFVCGGQWTRAKAGTFVFGPRNIPHGFKVVGDAPARLLLLCTPKRLRAVRRRDADLAPRIAGGDVLESLRSARLRETDKLAHFVLGTCRMTVLDSRRSAQRQEQLLAMFGGDLVPDARAMPTLDDRQLARCVQGLKERERSVVVMTFYDEQTAAETAGALGISEANVRVIRHRALQQLRACLGAEA